MTPDRNGLALEELDGQYASELPSRHLMETLTISLGVTLTIATSGVALPPLPTP